MKCNACGFDQCRSVYLVECDVPKQTRTQFCRACGAGIGPFRRDGEGTCPACDPTAARVAELENVVRAAEMQASDWISGKDSDHENMLALRDCLRAALKGAKQ